MREKIRDFVAKKLEIMLLFIIPLCMCIPTAFIIFTQQQYDISHTTWHQVNSMDPANYHIAQVDSDSISVYQFNPEFNTYLLVWYGDYSNEGHDCFSSRNGDNAQVFLYEPDDGRLIFNGIVMTQDPQY